MLSELQAYRFYNQSLLPGSVRAHGSHHLFHCRVSMFSAEARDRFPCTFRRTSPESAAVPGNQKAEWIRRPGLSILHSCGRVTRHDRRQTLPGLYYSSSQSAGTMQAEAEKTGLIVKIYVSLFS